MRFTNSAELTAPTDNKSLLWSDPWEANATADPEGTFFEASCAPLHDILLAAVPAALGQGARPDGDQPPTAKRTIDLLSVDAEGAEVEIFRNFPFEAWDLRAVVVETSRQTATAIDSLLLPRGFLKIAVLGKDAVYVSQKIARALPPEGPVLPERIQWNEPGTDVDSIEYMRFQRFFGVDGDLDDEVGDQRLLNDTELTRQHQRSEDQWAADAKEVKRQAQTAAVGGVLSEEKRHAMEQPWVQETLRDAQVKNALAFLHAGNWDAYTSEVRASTRLRSKLADLVDAGLLAADLLDESAA